MKRSRLAQLSFALSLFVMGCTIGPDYLEPRPQVPTSFNVADTSPSSTIGPHPEAAWWRVLGDAQLNRLVEDAVEQNQDLLIARTRVREVRALRRAAGSARAPQIDAALTGQKVGLSENAPDAGSRLIEAGLADDETNVFESGFDASWELDIFGGVRRSVEAADARLAAAIAGKDHVVLSVIAETVRHYTEWRGAQRRLELAKKNLDLQRDTLALASNRYQAGLVSDLDVQRARAQVETTSARLPPLRASIQAAAYRLAYLTGHQPQDLPLELPPAAGLVEPPDVVPTGLPSELLRRRPDIRQSERQLAAASADLGVATADLFPRFFLTGAAGGRSESFSDLFEAASRLWSFGPQIRWPVFRGGQLRAGVEAADARLEIAYIQYQQKVLLALEEVETALVFYAEESLRQRSLLEAVKAARKAVKLARALYRQGLDDFLVVLDAERSLTALEDQLTGSEITLILRTLSLYKSLGGGWQDLASNQPLETPPMLSSF